MSKNERIKEKVKKLCDILEIDHIGLISDGVKKLMDKFNKMNENKKPDHLKLLSELY